MIIDIYLNEYKEIIQSSKKIGKTYENKSTVLKFHLLDGISDLNLYLDIQGPDGTKSRSSSLAIINGIAEYTILNSLLEQTGILLVEPILQNNDGYVLKYPTLEFEVTEAINAIQAVEDEQPDFVSQCQTIIDLFDITGDGTQYLADDGAYKPISGGTTDYNTLENKPIINVIGTDEEPIYLQNLTAGIYRINGLFMPYANADISDTVVNHLVLIETDGIYNYVNLFDTETNRLEHYQITLASDEYTRNTINFSTLQQEKIISIFTRTRFSSTLIDNTSYQCEDELSTITINLPDVMENTYRSWLIFNTGNTVPTFNNSNVIKWHGDAVSNNILTLNPNKSYTIEFWKDMHNINAEVREV